MRLAAGWISCGRGSLLINKGVSEFFPEITADVIIHRFAACKYGQSVATFAESDCLSHSALTDNSRFRGVIQNITINVDSKIFLEIARVRYLKRFLAPTSCCSLRSDCATLFSRKQFGPFF